MPSFVVQTQTQLSDGGQNSEFQGPRLGVGVDHLVVHHSSLVLLQFTVLGALRVHQLLLCSLMLALEASTQWGRLCGLEPMCLQELGCHVMRLADVASCLSWIEIVSSCGLVL